MKAAFLLIVCMLTLLTVMNSAEATIMTNNFGNAFGILGYYCDIGKNIHEVWGWNGVSGYWGAVIGLAVGGFAGVIVGIGVAV